MYKKYNSTKLKNPHNQSIIRACAEKEAPPPCLIPLINTDLTDT